jgi:transposase
MVLSSCFSSFVFEQIPEGMSPRRHASGRGVNALDPLSWTRSERRIRCPTCPEAAVAGARAGSSRTSFKEGAVRLVLDEGKTVGAAARELDLTPSALGGWVRQARADRTKGKSGLMKEEREELARLRKEVRELRLERDLLKKVSALFAKDQR